MKSRTNVIIIGFLFASAFALSGQMKVENVCSILGAADSFHNKQIRVTGFLHADTHIYLLKGCGFEGGIAFIGEPIDTDEAQKFDRVAAEQIFKGDRRPVQVTAVGRYLRAQTRGDQLLGPRLQMRRIESVRVTELPGHECQADRPN